MTEFGVVVIGRNEERILSQALDSSLALTKKVIYVDSGSIDQSLNIARSKGVQVLALDSAQNFSAARARNEGLSSLLQKYPELEVVQFLDGDCVLVADWGSKAMKSLAEDTGLGAVCGLLREAHPEASLFNRLCSLEWDRTLGEIDACGGVAMVRVKSFQDAGGFDLRLVAGEEASFYSKMRAKGWKVSRINQEMARHDSAIFGIKPWWIRSMRAGRAYLLGATCYPEPERKTAARISFKIWIWAFFLPLFSLGFSFYLGVTALFFSVLYLALALRVAFYRRRREKDSWPDSFLYGFFSVIEKWPQLLGQISSLFQMDKVKGRS